MAFNNAVKLNDIYFISMSKQKKKINEMKKKESLGKVFVTHKINKNTKLRDYESPMNLLNEKKNTLPQLNKQS